MDIAIELERFGPHAKGTVFSLEQAESYTWDLATSHYENFPVVSIFVPHRLRQHFANVYAYCRWADDLGDEIGDRELSTNLLQWWREQLLGCYAGEPKHPVMVALRHTVQQFLIPPEPFLHLIEAFELDQVQMRYSNYEQLLGYCKTSADPVGRIVLHLCERVSPENLIQSDSICTGLQLINFWQDVARDYKIGRIYLPVEDQEHFGVTAQQIAEGTFNKSFRDLLAMEVERAELLLRAGLPLSRKMPGRLKLVIALFARGGLAIAQKIRRQDFDVLSKRPKLAKLDFARLCVSVCLGR